MELKHVIPNMEKTFGNLEFAGENKVEQRRINGRMTVDLMIPSATLSIVKKILILTAVQYTLECGFSHYTAGTTIKAQEQHFFYVLVLFYCLKRYKKFFSKIATNRTCMASVSAKREETLLSPFSLARKGVRL